MKTKVVEAVNCSVLKLTRLFCSDEVRWQEGSVTLIWIIGPYFSAIMKLHATYLQSLPSFPLYVATTCFEFFPSWLNPCADYTHWALFELDEGGHLAGHRSHLITTISLVHLVSKLYSCNKGTGLVTYMLVAIMLLHAWDFGILLMDCCCWILWLLNWWVATSYSWSSIRSGSLHVLYICGCTNPASGAWFLRGSAATRILQDFL